jgi:hypothetical protein
MSNSVTSAANGSAMGSAKNFVFVYNHPIKEEEQHHHHHHHRQLLFIFLMKILI